MTNIAQIFDLRTDSESSWSQLSESFCLEVLKMKSSWWKIAFYCFSSTTRSCKYNTSIIRIFIIFDYFSNLIADSESSRNSLSESFCLESLKIKLLYRKKQIYTVFHKNVSNHIIFYSTAQPMLFHDVFFRYLPRWYFMLNMLAAHILNNSVVKSRPTILNPARCLNLTTKLFNSSMPAL